MRKITKKCLSLFLAISLAMTVVPMCAMNVFSADAENVVRNEGTSISETTLTSKFYEFEGLSLDLVNQVVTHTSDARFPQLNAGFALADENGNHIRNINAGGNITLVHNSVYTVTYYVATRNGLNYRYSTQKSFKFKFLAYHVITSAVTNAAEVPVGGIKVTNNGTPTNLKNGESMEVDYGSNVTIEAIAVDGYNVTAFNNPIVNPVQASGTVTVTYEALRYFNVAVGENIAEGGVVTVNGGDTTNPVQIGEEGTAQISIAHNKADGYSYYVTGITVNGQTLAFTTANDVTTANFAATEDKVTENSSTIDVAVTYSLKKFAAYDNSAETPIDIDYDFGKSVSAQLDKVKREIFNKVVDESNCIPDNITYDKVTYNFFAVGKLTQNYSDKSWAIDNDETLYNKFAERGNGCVEKLELVYNSDGVKPAVSKVVYVKLNESRKYTITWKNDDGTVLETDTSVVHGTTPEYNGSTPTKNNDAQYTYTFAGWSPAVAAADKDIVYTATYGTTTNTYTVVWKDHDGTVLETDVNVPYGTNPTYDNGNGLGTTDELASALNTAQYTYAFAGWTPVVNTVTGSVVYTATYTTTLNKYTITFKNYDGTVLQSGLVSFGEIPSYEGATPVKPADAQYTYTFNGWDNTVKAVDGEMTYTAIYSNIVNKYTVIWKNENGTVLETDTEVPYGEMPQYNGKTPLKADDGHNIYYFDKWSPVVDAVKGDAEYIATFTTVAKIKVTFSVLGNTERYTNVIPGEKVVAYDNPIVAGYRFDGWFSDAECTTAFDFDNAVINSATTIYAKMTKMHTVAFNTSGGTPTIENQLIEDNGLVTVPDTTPDKLGETFIGWYLGDEPYDFTANVTTNITLVAKYGIDIDNDEKVDGSEEDPFLTYIWQDGEVLAQKTVLSGVAVPTYIINDPADNNKVFAGWTQTISGNTIMYTANWADDFNNNDVADKDETATITVNKTGDGTVTFITNGNVIFKDNLDGTYTLIYDSTDDASKQVTVNVQPTDTGVSDKKNYVVSAPKSVTVTSGANTVVTVEFALRELIATGNKNVTVNGFSADTKISGLNKKKVLESILGRTLTDEEFAKYTVKMYVHLADLPILGTIEGYIDIWDLAARNYGDTINAAIKSAIAKAIDVGGRESIEVTWLADGIYPEVKGYYDITLTEKRNPTTVTHIGGTYTSGELDSALLESIKMNLRSNTNILGVEFGNNSHIDFVSGKTYTLNLIVTVEETLDYYGAKVPVTASMYVPYTKATVTIESSANMNYNTGMTDSNKVEMVISAVKPQYVPELPVGINPTVWYLASEARLVDVTINFAQMDLGLAGKFLPDTATIQIPVGETWVNIGDELVVPAAPSNDRIRDIMLNDLIPNYGADYIAGHLTNEQMMSILATTLNKYPDVAEYYKYLGAHYFGESTNVDAEGRVLERVYVSIPDFGYGTARSSECVLALSDNRLDVVIKLNEGVAVTYGKYSAAELLASLVEGVYDANGNRIGGAELVSFVTDVNGLPVSDASIIEVKFNGDINYKPTTASINVVINKAPVKVTIDNQIIKWGNDYNKLPVITNPQDVDYIQFVAGLDVSDVNIDNGIKGIVGNVQLILPKELQELLVLVDDMVNESTGLNVSFADGASLSLSDLKTTITALNGVFADTKYEEYFNILVKMLSSLPTDTADIMITLGGELPTNVGVYLVGAVTADTNYETAFGIGALVIYPDGIKADIAWNQEDDNNIVTNSLLASGAFDTAAHATSVGDGGDVDFATSQILELFIGVDINANITLETDQKKLNVGAYVELAGIVNWGNQVYYSNILARPIIVAAETLDIEFVDHTGAVNNERWFEFDNTSKNYMEGNIKVTYKQDGDGYKAGDVVERPYSVRYLYVGIQSNGVPYESEVAPVNAGTYTITAIVVITNDDGTISHAGQGVGAFVVEPSKSTIKVENELIKWDNKEHKVNNFVETTSVNVPALTPDTIIISAGVYADLDANIGLDSIKGNINIDMPVWLDEIIKKLGVLDAAYADGIDASVVINYTARIKEELDSLEIDSSSFDSIIKVIEQLPTKAKLTFHDDKGYKDAGTYLIIGIVTDSNHYPSIDAGLMVIYPDYEKAELHWNYNDSNNIFTLDTLSVVDLGANATLNGVHTDKVSFKEVFVGINTETMEVILTENQADLGIGLYTELAYVVGLDNQMYVAKPIVREIIVVPNIYDVNVGDKHFVYDGTAKDIGEIVVYDQFNNDITANGTIYVTYMGITGAVEGYLSTEAPTEAGIYSVIVTFITFNDNNYPIGVGSRVVNLVIEKADPVFDLKDTEVLYNGSDNFVVVENNQNVDYISVIRTENGINLILTDGLKDLADYLGDEVYNLSSLENAMNDVINAFETYKLESEFISKLLEVIKTIDNNMVYKITINGSNPVEAGEYKVYAVTVPNENYGVDVSEATLIINQIKIVISVDNKEISLGENPKFTYTIVEGGLVNGDEMAVEFTKGYDTNNVGIYDITALVTAGDSYDITVIPGVLKVNPLNITYVEVLGTYIYNDSEQTAQIVVKCGNKILVEGQDYVITGNKYTEAGNYTLTVEGIGNYAGTLSVDWSVAAKTLGANDVALDGTLTYTGAEQTQKVTVVDGITYTVTGNKATNAGDYTLTVTFTGNYSGSVELPWSVAAKTLGANDVALDGTLTYTGAEQTQKVTVADGITYTVTGNKATNVGDYTLTVTFTGNYSGSVELSWSIVKAPLIGDADGNEVVDMFDACLILRYYSSNGEITANEIDLTVSDVDGDGTVDMFDASLILQYYSGEIARFPVEQ